MINGVGLWFFPPGYRSARLRVAGELSSKSGRPIVEQGTQPFQEYQNLRRQAV